VVIVAGDIYDRSVPPAAAVELLDSVIDRICRDLDVPMILIAGNHDSPERLSFGARQLATAGLHVVGSLWSIPQPIVLTGRDGERVAFYPLPYTDPATVRHVHDVEVSSHEEALAHLIAIVEESRAYTIPAVAIAHCFLSGGEGSESERPLSIGGIEYVPPQLFTSFSYTALGHLHAPQYRGDETICYSGSPLKYSFSEETQKKSVTLIDLTAAGEASIEKIPLTPLRDMRTLEGTLDHLLVAGQKDPHREDYLRVRLTDTHAILDVMNKLRDVYPNVLHLERPDLVAKRILQADRQRLKRGELAMFCDFFQQITGAELSSQQEQIVASALQQLQQGES
jgi:exonuclease SbcD